MATSTSQFNGEVGNIESNVNKTDVFESGLSDAAKKQKYPSLKCISDLINKLFPVGIILSFGGNTDPNELYGGTWERIKDTFLLAAGDTYSAGSTGGETEHTLTVNEIPSHSHLYTVSVQHGDGEQTSQESLASGIQQGGRRRYHDISDSAGGGQPHNNMPPYLVVNVWKRTK